MQISLYDEVIKIYHILHEVYDIIKGPAAIDTTYTIYDYNITKQHWSSKGIAFAYIGYRNSQFLMIDENAVVYAYKAFGSVDPIGTLNDLSVSAKAYFIQEINKKVDKKSPNFGKYFTDISPIYQYKCEPIYVN